MQVDWWMGGSTRLKMKLSYKTGEFINLQNFDTSGAGVSKHASEW